MVFHDHVHGTRMDDKMCLIITVRIHWVSCGMEEERAMTIYMPIMCQALCQAL